MDLFHCKNGGNAIKYIAVLVSVILLDPMSRWDNIQLYVYTRFPERLLNNNDICMWSLAGARINTPLILHVQMINRDAFKRTRGFHLNYSHLAPRAPVTFSHSKIFRTRRSSGYRHAHRILPGDVSHSARAKMISGQNWHWRLIVVLLLVVVMCLSSVLVVLAVRPPCDSIAPSGARGRTGRPPIL